MTEQDSVLLTKKLGIKSVIDLRGTRRLEQTGIGPLSELDIKVFNIPLNLVADAKTNQIKEQFQDNTYTNMGEVYLYRIKDEKYTRNIIEAQEVIANSTNQPLVFHCNAGKDRSGILAAILLSVLGVADEDIIRDYTLTSAHMKKFLDRWDNDPVTADVHRNLPDYHLLATPESMEIFLRTVREEYGSVEEYLYAHGADPALIEKLRQGLLV